MSSRLRHRRSHRQRGLALLLTFVVLLLGSANLFTYAIRADSEQVRREHQTARALRRAKQALLHYAATYYFRLLDSGADHVAGSAGFLPCADTPGIVAGAQSGNCGGRNVNQLGRLPWRTLGTGPLRDGDHECLWYVVSGAYKDDRAAPRRSRLLNADSNGTLQLYTTGGALSHGPQPHDRLVAVVISAGAPLTSQRRAGRAAGSTCGGNHDAPNYLEGDGVIDNATLARRVDAVDRIISGDATSHLRAVPFNDRALGIGRGELWRRVMSSTFIDRGMRPMQIAVARCVARYGLAPPDRRLPFPAPLAAADDHATTGYRDTDAGISAGRLPDRVPASNAATGKIIDRLLGDCPSTLLTQAQQVLWSHWKDHFFLVVSRRYRPDAAARPLRPIACAPRDCVVSGGTRHAALLIYAGERRAGQVRSASLLGPDGKRDVSNYLEGALARNFPDTDGNRSYDRTGDSNDELYCIADNANLRVGVCP